MEALPLANIRFGKKISRSTAAAMFPAYRDIFIFFSQSENRID